MSTSASRPGHCRDARREPYLRLGHGLIGAAVAAWSAVALVGFYELLMIIRGAQAAEAAPSPQGDMPVTDPL